MAANPDHRQRFIQTAHTLITGFGFNGIDIDWEFPGSHQDKVNVYMYCQNV